MRRPGLNPPLLGIMALAVVLRTLVWWPRHNFFGVLEYDDGVYYVASKLLLAGRLPYSDFTIVHPPGLSLLLLPAAAVGDLLGDAAGMAAGRIEMQLFVLANIALIYRLGRLLPLQSGSRVPLLAAGLYALMPNAVSAGHTILLEPLVTFACLLGSWLLFRPPSPGRGRLFLAGFCFAAGTGLKLFAGAYVLAAVVTLLAAKRYRALGSVVLGGVAGTVLLLVPFFLADPRAAWHDVVVTQLSRPTNPSVPHGLDRIASTVGFGYATVPLGLLLLVAIALGTVLAWRRTRSPQLLYWAVFAVPVLLAFSGSPTYFLHYGEFLGPAVALLASQLAVLGGRMRWPQLALAAVVVVFGIGTGVAATDVRGQPDLRALAAAHVPDHACVYYDAVSLALAAEVYQPSSPTCPSYVDGRGVALTQNTDWPNRTSFYPAGFVADTAWQLATVAQMRASQFLLLRHDPTDFPEWDTATREYAVTHFAVVARHRGGRQPFELWQRVRPG